MIKSVDAWLNTVTMYRLTVYVLVGLLVAAAGLSAVRIMGLDPFALEGRAAPRGPAREAKRQGESG